MGEDCILLVFFCNDVYISIWLFFNKNNYGDIGLLKKVDVNNFLEIEK